MNLPRYDLPMMTTTLPFSKRKVKYRPYTTKEEKIMMLAMVSGAEQDMRDAVTQIVENCTDVKVKELVEVDFEYLYIRLISVSDTAIAKVIVRHQCTTDECPVEHEAVVNLETTEIGDSQALEKAGFISKKDGWLIPFKSVKNMGLCVVPYTTTFDENDDDYLYRVTQYVYEGDKLYDSFTSEEFAEWIGRLKLEDFQRIAEFMSLIPQTKLAVETKCTHCGAAINKTLSGVLNFLQ